MEQKYSDLTTKFKDIIPNLRGYSLSADIWTQSKTTTSYVGLTLHYLDDQDMEMRSLQFGVEALEKLHSKKYIAQQRREMCAEWNILAEKVIIIVPDNEESIKRLH